jgi:hypothetical protein
MANIVDLTGQTFNWLTVIGDDGTRASDGSIMWLCLCRCGKTTHVRSVDLKRGNTCSCGCARDSMGFNDFTGTKKSPEYISYRNMINRCYQKNHDHYGAYGGRGIRVCERWLPGDGQGYKNFLADMGPRFPGYTNHRLDHDADYSPDVCIWSRYHDETLDKESADSEGGNTNG